MYSKTADNFDGLDFLDELETVFKSAGFQGVVNLVEDRLPIGSNVKMARKIENMPEPVYKIERIRIYRINPESVVRTLGDIHSGSVIRSIKLPYVDDPFQIDIYGSPV